MTFKKVEKILNEIYKKNLTWHKNITLNPLKILYSVTNPQPHPKLIGCGNN